MALLPQYSPVLAEQLQQVRATEQVLEQFLFRTDVTCIILQAGDQLLTVPVTAAVGAAVVHELLLGTIDTGNEVAQQLNLVPVTSH